MADCWATMLVAVDRDTGCLRAIALLDLAAADNPAESLAEFLDGLHVSRVVLTSDSEPAVSALKRYHGQSWHHGRTA